MFARAVLNQDLEDLRFGFGIKTVSGVVVFNLDQLKEAGPGPLPQGAEVTAELELTMWLAPGEYFITFGLLPLDGPHHDRLPDAVLLRVVGDEKMSPASLVNLEPRLGLIRLDGPSSKGEHGNKGPDEP